MLSILIPVYNFDVSLLVKELLSQARNAKISFEILCFDDHSTLDLNAVYVELENNPELRIKLLSGNYGRAKIRNLLAREAKFQNLLFLDCDSMIRNPRFIDNYLYYTGTEKVIYGGRTYMEQIPSDKKEFLHWKYGHKRESLPAEDRNENPYLNFMSNNFLISKVTMLENPFDESIEGYGYEDLVFAKQLQESGVQVTHIENPVIHGQLETNLDFLRKSENALRNLVILYKEGKIQSTRLIDTHRKCLNTGLIWGIRKYTEINKQKLVDNLLSEKVRLINFSILKLWLFDRLLNGQEGSFFS